MDIIIKKFGFKYNVYINHTRKAKKPTSAFFPLKETNSVKKKAIRNQYQKIWQQKSFFSENKAKIVMCRIQKQEIKYKGQKIGKRSDLIKYKEGNDYLGLSKSFQNIEKLQEEL